MGNSIPERFIRDVFSRLPDSIRKAIGERERRANNSARSVVAVPRGASQITQPDRPGDPRQADYGRILLLRRFQIDWYVFAAPEQNLSEPDFADSEELYQAVLVAARYAGHHSIEFGNEVWTEQQDNADGFMRFGSEISFESIVTFPVYDDHGKLVKLTADPAIVTTVQLNEDPETVTINQTQEAP